MFLSSYYFCRREIFERKNRPPVLLMVEMSLKILMKLQKMLIQFTWHSRQLIRWHLNESKRQIFPTNLLVVQARQEIIRRRRPILR